MQSLTSMGSTPDKTLSDTNPTLKGDKTLSGRAGGDVFYLIQSNQSLFSRRRRHALPQSGKFSIGRSRSSDLMLGDQHISSSHAGLSWKNGQWILQDNDSTNGTFVNDVRIREKTLQVGDEIGFGLSPIRLELTDQPPASFKPLLFVAAGFVLGLISVILVLLLKPDTPPGISQTAGPHQDVPPGSRLTYQAASPAPALRRAPSSNEAPDRSYAYQPVPVLNFDDIVYRQTVKTAIYRYAMNPQVFVLDFPSLYIQGRTMNRVMALIEDYRTPKDRVLSEFEFQQLLDDHQLSTESFTLGHDYTSRHLTRFFRLADRHGIALRPEEEKLREILIEHDIIRQDLADQADERVIVTVPQVTTEIDRRNIKLEVDLQVRREILRHELSHGLFFLNSAYRQHAENFWAEKMPDYLKRRVGRFLTELGYDVSDEFLTVNEMQAFLFHTNHEMIFSAPDVGITYRELEQLKQEFFADIQDMDFIRDISL